MFLIEIFSCNPTPTTSMRGSKALFLCASFTCAAFAFTLLYHVEQLRKFPREGSSCALPPNQTAESIKYHVLQYGDALNEQSHLPWLQCMEKYVESHKQYLYTFAKIDAKAESLETFIGNLSRRNVERRNFLSSAKPVVLLKAIQAISDGSFLVYVDTDICVMQQHRTIQSIVADVESAAHRACDVLGRTPGTQSTVDSSSCEILPLRASSCGNGWHITHI